MILQINGAVARLEIIALCSEVFPEARGASGKGTLEKHF